MGMGPLSQQGQAGGGRVGPSRHGRKRTCGTDGGGGDGSDPVAWGRGGGRRWRKCNGGRGSERERESDRERVT